MQAAVMRPGSFKVEDRPKPVPGSGQVLVRTVACGICGSDLHLFRHAQALYEQALEMGVDKKTLDNGVVMGHEFIGEVVEFGPDCKKNKASLGERVCSIPFLVEGDPNTLMGATPFVDGAYAEYFLLAEDLLVSIPSELPTEAAVLTEPIAIGEHAVNKGFIDQEAPAVVLGCGPIGLAIIAVLATRGVKTIVAADMSPRRRELAQAMGATHTVDAATGSPFDALPEIVAQRACAVFECTGVNGLIAQAVAEAPSKSQIVVAGIAHGEDSFVPQIAIIKELSMHFVSFYGTNEFKTALEYLVQGQVNWQPLITGKVDLHGVEDAFNELKDPEAHAKVLIYPHGIE